MHYEAKITKAGQLTIPKDIRDILNTDLVSFIVEDKSHKIYLTPIQDVGGALTKYSKKASFEEARSQAWLERIDELSQGDE